MHPETKIAMRFVERNAIEPPVDIRHIVAQHAIIEETALPVTADAITLHLKDPTQKPRIIINRFSDESRKKFTLAHELGHILIPWHVGTVVSHTNSFQYFVDEIYSALETEANRFAREVLLPSKWVQTQLLTFGGDPARTVIALAKKAEVSMLMTSITVLDYLPAGYIFAAIDETGVVQQSGKSPGTAATAPNKHQKIKSIDSYFPMASYIREVQAGNNHLVWWSFTGLPDEIKQEMPEWRNVLQDIFSDLQYSKEDQKTYIQKLSGIIGAANSKYKQATAEELCSIVCQRVSSKEELHEIANHEKCIQFITCRIRQLKDKV